MTLLVILSLHLAPKDERERLASIFREKNKSKEQVNDAMNIIRNVSLRIVVDLSIKIVDASIAILHGESCPTLSTPEGAVMKALHEVLPLGVSIKGSSLYDVDGSSFVAQPEKAHFETRAIALLEKLAQLFVKRSS